MPFIRILLAALAVAVSCIAHAQAPSEPPTQVNINTADAATMARVLDGVGLKKAQAIVEHREQNGRFDAAAELAKVKGIGPSTVAKNSAKIVVSSESGTDTSAPPE